MGHPDFRVGGKIFATLGYPSAGWAMVKLFPDQQRDYMAAEPETFTPANGAWGKQGCTCVALEGANPARVEKALHAAWRKVAVRTALEQVERGQTPGAATRRNRAKSRAALPSRETS